MALTPASASSSRRGTIELIAGIVLVVVWVAVQFTIAPPTGWLHVPLGAGVLLIIRGIAIRD